MHRPGKLLAFPGGSTGWTAGVLLGIAVGAVSAQNSHPIPEAERWATITHPGNEPWVGPSFYGFQTLTLGRVDYEYRISRTEVAGAEWFGFVQAYAPYVGDGAFSIDFTSNLVTVVGGYRLISGAENKPVEVGWRYAARYANWLHNGKALTQEAFESGAYDTSTFATNPDGSFTDQISRSPGARYWIPSLDEMIKAWHFDPDRFGPDQPGCWLYSTSSDSPPVYGPPGVGQTNAGTNVLRDVASYLDVQSPWGLWDASGGVTEWTETTNPRSPQFLNPIVRAIDGSSWRSPGPIPDPFSDSRNTDRINALGGAGPQIPQIGFRLAREIPSPQSGVVLFSAFHLFTLRRRSAHDTHRFHAGLGSRPRRDGSGS